MTFDISLCPIGKDVVYPLAYDPRLLFTIPRDWTRARTFGEARPVQMLGFDVWNDYELMWKDRKGEYQAGCLEMIFDAHSPYLIESKSLKLYLFSCAALRSAEEGPVPCDLLKMIENDLSNATKSSVRVRLHQLRAPCAEYHAPQTAIDLDALTANLHQYTLDPDLLTPPTGGEDQTRSYIFRNFRFLCMVTARPDVATLYLQIKGPEVDPMALYRYLVSFRMHKGIHEQCIEKIFFDLSQKHRPVGLSVLGLFNRRGGLGINPLRTSEQSFHLWPQVCRVFGQ